VNQTPGLVLVTTDGSQHSRRVLPHAATFAKARGDRLALLHVLDNASGRDAAISDGSKALRDAGVEGTPLTTTKQSGENIERAIVRVAAEQGANMIAMDTRGHGALHHAIHGSTALEVLSLTELPVLLTGAGLEDMTSPVEPCRIVVTTDGSSASRDVMRALGLQLAPGRFAVTLLQVHERDPNVTADASAVAEIKAQLEQDRAFFQDGLEIDTQVKEIARLGGIDTAIIETARQVGASAIAASSHGTSAQRHLFAGGTALTLLGRSPVPVIMARGAE
jgi:nucleotide-binding universal stress UspA family protein